MPPALNSSVQHKEKGKHRDRKRQVEITAEILARCLHCTEQQREPKDQCDIDDVAAQGIAQADLRLSGECGNGGNR